MSAASSSADFVGSLSLRVGPGDQVAVVDVQINAIGPWSGSVPFGIGGAPASVSNFAFRHAAPGSGLSVPASRDPQGNLTFSDAAVPGFLIGTASHSSSQLVCSQIAPSNAPCNGTFNLAASGVRMLTVSGVVPASATGSASVSVSGAAPFSIANPGWGYVNAQAFWTGTLSGGNTCVADFNAGGGVTVQDIFDYLTAWFASDPRADISGGGVGVQDIFDFLSLWFTGCS